MKFTDIHSHYIFSVDDGAKSIEQSIEMIKQAAASNIDHLLATPHATDLTNRKISSRILKHFAEVKTKAKEEQIAVQLSLGSEIFFHQRVSDLYEYPWFTFNNNKKYLLFELPLYDMPEKVGDFIFKCRLKGLRPVLAHPERYLYLHDKIETLLSWHRQGCLMQMNAGSLLGQFGQKIADKAKIWLEASFYGFIASDAHELKFRNYETLPAAYKVAGDIIGTNELNEIFYENPQKAINGYVIVQTEADEQSMTKGWLDKFYFSLKKIPGIRLKTR